ncbi:alpha/beta hydrolase [Crenobacter cavernae]|uniref:Alpha/beta hydrolase n=1 Tax=Crenobacter cavernae TaxID=2290923 RepID=A0ABY0F9L1_9NEIS|nr:alpha/beta fold hydrolase [Crenobacter cavernae]RXZ42164.1 alpha/beta hydrolase [Crenobacter cavernae]
MATPRLELLHEAPTTAARNAPPLLFVHGGFCNAHCWRPMMKKLAGAGFACYALSLEGHGGSDGRAYLPMIGIADYVNNLAAVGADFASPPVLIGHSMGGFVIQQYLARHPAAAVALLASVPPSGLAASSWRLTTRSPAMLMRLNLYQQGQYQPDLAELREMLFSPAASDRTIAEFARHAQPESQRAVLEMAFVPPLLQPRLPDVPALVLGATGDALISADDVAATARRLRSPAEMLPGIGHMMMLDAGWERVAARLLSWLDTLHPAKYVDAAA